MTLAELAGNGWTVVQPPEPTDEQSVVGRYNGEPIKGGVRTAVKADTESAAHYQYRSGKYDLEVKIDFDIGRGMIRVAEAEGYD